MQKLFPNKMFFYGKHLESLTEMQSAPYALYKNSLIIRFVSKLINEF